MRIDRLIILMLLMAACKPVQVVTTTAYKEDLSVHRLDFEPIDTQEKSSDVEFVDNSEAIYYPNEITSELDSVNQLIVNANIKRKYWDGYVIQVYRGNSRSDAYKVMEAMNDFFPTLDAKVSYYQPTYRVKAGSFFNRLKATRTYQDVKELYPRALLLPEKLPLPDQNADN
jgi:hypothetical protein